MSVSLVLLKMADHAQVGAIWSSCPPEFGIQATLERFEQVKSLPLLLVMVDN